MVESRRSLRLGRHGNEALHVTLARLLQTRIDEGAWAPGAQLPSVRELADEFGTSTVTVARAERVLASAGAVHTHQGKGVFVADRIGAGRVVDQVYSWQSALLPPRKPSRLTTLLVPVVPREDTISLASGGVASDVLPTAGEHSAWSQLVHDHELSLLEERIQQHLPLGGISPAGWRPLCSWIAGSVTTAGVRTTAERILVTAGAQQALDLVARTLLRPGDIVLVERPTCVFALAVFESVGARCVEVPVDEHGLIVEAVHEPMATSRARLLFTVPTGHAPTGVTMPLARRAALLDAACRHGVMILEEEHASEFSYDRPPPPAIKSLDYDGHVIYMRGFGKIAPAALRIGAMVADGPVLAALIETKRLTDRETSTLSQGAFLAHVTGELFSEHLERARTLYRERRDALLTALRCEMPDGTVWSEPAAGFNVWVTLPPGISARAVARQAAALGVLVLPSGPFYAQNDPDTALRLTFSDNEPARLAVGVRRLAQAVCQVTSLAPVAEEAELVDLVVA